MTTRPSSASWLPAAIARAAVVNAPPAQDVPRSGRHSAPEVPGTMRIATPEGLLRTGRHAEPEWSRDLHDPKRDEADSLSWLGFRPTRH
ncbi:hypothetical protein FHU33_3718 [Blastococcus colisei]|uniref:Uncharacterized protein n=1 Tax=Blastococcus colisei TaxID=1564162 RepID=A0A543PJF8_9ACTN|nr:hypothetical protein [Blastococcus colisei]TQN44223.1 hypothetical protein FHU33_3718 [Blastococcus colisei]